MAVGSDTNHFTVEDEAQIWGWRPRTLTPARTLLLQRLLTPLRVGLTGALPSAIVRYGLTVGVIGALALVRSALFADFPAFFLFAPFVILLTLFLSGKAGILASVLTTVNAGFVLHELPPVGALSPVQFVATTVFGLTNLSLVGVVVLLRQALIGAHLARSELSESAAAGERREAFLTSVLASSTDCIKVLDLDGKLTFMTEGGQRVMEVSDFNAIAGCPWPDFWAGNGHAEAVAAVQGAREGRSASFVGRASTMMGTPKWWHVAVSPIAGPDGRPLSILSVSRDITVLRESEEERDRFVRLAENSTDFIGMAHVDGHVFYMNDAARRLVGLDGTDITTLAIADFFPPEDAATVADEVLPAVVRDGHWAGELSFRHFMTGELIPVLYSVFPVTDTDGRTLGYGTVTRDFRAHKRAEEDMRMMNGELAHRLKNVLAVVQSVAHQTLRNAIDMPSASESLSARLVALGAATDVLTGGSWRSADLRALAEHALAPHGELRTRIILDGPPVALQPPVAVALALALHELATNAAKYGALANDSGTITLTWGVRGGGEALRLWLRWQEYGGPPVMPPTRRGFGTNLIQRSLRAYFSGEAVTDYAPEGLTFILETGPDEAVWSIGKVQ